MSEHDPYAEEKRTTPSQKRVGEANDVKWLMSSKQGRRVVWRLLDKAGVYRTSFTGNSETFFKEGMRNMGLFILDEITRHSPDGMVAMLNESRTNE